MNFNQINNEKILQYWVSNIATMSEEKMSVNLKINKSKINRIATKYLSDKRDNAERMTDSMNLNKQINPILLRSMNSKQLDFIKTEALRLQDEKQFAEIKQIEKELHEKIDQWKKLIAEKPFDSSDYQWNMLNISIEELKHQYAKYNASSH